MNLCNLGEVRRVLEKYGTAPQKRFGQNFLVTPSIPERIAEEASADAPAHTCALEIGPGVGALTQQLSAFYEDVAALEIDRNLLPVLEETLADCGNVTVISGDVMKTDVPKLIDERFGERPVDVCANLPYYITTPVLMKLLDELPASRAPRIRAITVMVQNEVAARICAKPGNDEYGALSVAVAMRGTAEKMFTVSAGHFYPVPKVSSAVVKITLYPDGPAAVFPELRDDPEGADALFERAKELCALAFQTRRKTLCNSLGSRYEKSRVSAALDEMCKRTDARGETLSAAEFITLAKKLS